jgi:hypothetical protein
LRDIDVVGTGEHTLPTQKPVTVLNDLEDAADHEGLVLGLRLTLEETANQVVFGEGGVASVRQLAGDLHELVPGTDFEVGRGRLVKNVHRSGTPVVKGFRRLHGTPMCRDFGSGVVQRERS